MDIKFICFVIMPDEFVLRLKSTHYMAKILPILCKTLSNQLINQSIEKFRYHLIHKMCIRYDTSIGFVRYLMYELVLVHMNCFFDMKYVFVQSFTFIPVENR